MILENLGMSLRSFQENHTSGILSLNEVGSLGIAMIKAIREFHNLGFVHRDLKLDNILMHDGHPVIADFGLSRKIGMQRSMQVTFAGSPV